MNSWRWRMALVYLVSGVVLFGASTFLFGKQEKIDNLPMGAEVIGQGFEEGQSGKDLEKIKALEVVKEQEVAKEMTVKSYSQADRVKAELALVGIKSVEKSIQAVETKNVESKSAKTKNIRDFPSPIQSVPLKVAGNYYSEALQAYLFHAGTDYSQAEGAVIRVKHSGKVIYAGPDPILGQKVEVDCGEDWSVIYGGLENLRVKEGDQVEVNQAIGQVGYYPGADGVRDQPQLHYEVWHGDQVQIPS